MADAKVPGLPLQGNLNGLRSYQCMEIS
eukprot:IDg13342t1